MSPSSDQKDELCSLIFQSSGYINFINRNIELIVDYRKHNFSLMKSLCENSDIRLSDKAKEDILRVCQGYTPEQKQEIQKIMENRNKVSLSSEDR